jgi:putative ABC transport system substrate-binding protein
MPNLPTNSFQLGADVIVTSGAAVPALLRASTTIPIVFAVANDPVGAGMVKSLAEPGGNVTGISLQTLDLANKRFEFFREAVHISEGWRLWLMPLLVRPYSK